MVSNSLKQAVKEKQVGLDNILEKKTFLEEKKNNIV